MSIPSPQVEIAQFLGMLSARPPIETHISAVFVGTNTAWKLKKAVAFPFLDFTTPSGRKHFLLRELELNRKMAPGLYRDVAAIIRGSAGELCFAEADTPDALDWVLRMAVIPPENFFDTMAGRGEIGPALLTQIADMTVKLHKCNERVNERDVVGQLTHVIEDTAYAACRAGLENTEVHKWNTGILALLHDHASLLAERARGGFVRRAHGDLHLGNICLWHRKPLPFDALEFDEDLATIDIGYDLAFLLMDLDLRVGRAAANAVLNRYLARTGDLAQLNLYPLFLSLRAMIRAHILLACGAADAVRYSDAALAYLSPTSKPVIAIGGLQGTGKSTLARALAPSIGPAPGAIVLRSDELRKRLHGVLPETKLEPSAYEPEPNRLLNELLLQQVDLAAKSQHGVIVDASFLAAELRAAVETLARNAGREFLGLWLKAPTALLESRLAMRHGDASDADIRVMRAAAKISSGLINWHQLDSTEASTLQKEVKRLLGSVALRTKYKAAKILQAGSLW